LRETVIETFLESVKLAEQPTSREEVETESFMSLPKEEEKVELLQPLSVEESAPEDSTEPLDSETTTEEVHPTEVVYKEILPKESIACETGKSEERAVELSIQQPTSPEEAEAESFISLPKEEQKVYDAVLPKESIEAETVKTEQCAADLTVRPPAPPETAEAEMSLSIPKEEEEAVSLELQSAMPEVSASLDVMQPAKLEETVTEAFGDIQKPADVKQVEIEVPRPEIAEDVSLTVARQPTPEQQESAEASLSLATPKSPPEESDESVSLTLRQPEEETDADLSLKLKKSEDGMRPLGGAGARAVNESPCRFAASSSPCF